MLQLLCNACKGEFPASSFYKATTTTRGYQYKCKACASAGDKSEDRKAYQRAKVAQWRKNNPNKRKEQKRRHYEKHKERIDQRAKDWYENNKDRYINNALLRKYGVTLEKYNLLRAQQDFRCAICNEHESEIEKKMFVDHDHSTGKIRKLLCTRCNVGIGMFEDSFDRLISAAQYIRDHNG